MSAIVRATLPEGSLLADIRRPDDFLDCYACESPLPAHEAARIIAAFPPWAAALLRLRNGLMRPFGLRTEAPAGVPTFGPFPLDRETPDEVLVGFDDRHLDFRVSVLQRGGRIHCATWVCPHNPGGRAYLAAVMPFHVLIIRNALARVRRAG
ncbi:DUF2867 domain-containing protein [uncultured Paracoccus sp.]|uniref:DUF2867 domain-containing protein n=1 Tax=uncultured Paracoccus sp. TaxID=189685 RepID=UPI0025D83480|nr:DUF2867 domain-containing protein [uncultured Paracoccus sp.]